MTELEGLIHYWESILKEFSYNLDPSTMFFIKTTITYLKQLQDKKEVSK
ncbi:unnamed protein product [marine sediment metagenome]|uniref:Uncharacterized protein n=1 Tax=marine sediment metagenome TaxID=412755 RepID=X1NMF6_9ZZZZ